MIAVVGIPGSAHHEYLRVRTRREGINWAGRRESAIRDRNPAVGSLPTYVLTEKEAMRVRYQDGHRVYPLPARPFVCEWICVSDRYDPNAGTYESIEDFNAMCLHCFGEVPALRETPTGEWVETDGSVVLRPV